MLAREAHFRARLPGVFADLLSLPSEQVRLLPKDKVGDADADTVLDVAGQIFVIEWKSSSTVAVLGQAASQALARAQRISRRAIAVVAVPYMGESGRRLCQGAGVQWFDLSGNAHIVAPGLRVIVEGRPNLYARPGRPRTVFAPKSARITRWLLMHPESAFTQREISRATGVTEGLVSRVIAQLEADGLISRVGVDSQGDGAGGSGPGEGDGARSSSRKHPVRLGNPARLIDAWNDEYRFSNHRIVKGHVPARSGDALLQMVADALKDARIDYAATGLAAAWKYTHFAGFRLATFYLPDEPSEDLKRQLGFNETERGSNLWLVVPNDADVFSGAQVRDGIRCIHPVQVYLDLKDQPERAAEAAEDLRSQFLNWKEDDR